WTEQQGRGDLRPYYFVQFYPMLALPLMLLLLPARYTRTGDLFIALGWYVLAKVFEHPGDAPIYALGQVVSGHTLKHLAAAAGAYWILRMLQGRIGSESCPGAANLRKGSIVLGGSEALTMEKEVPTKDS